MKRKSAAEPTADRETSARLLDAAERLFGEHGYEGVGMRRLADEARTNLGAATYYYGSKKALYLETFLRRFRPVEAARLRLLREAEAEAGQQPVAVEKIVECMIRPPFELGVEHPTFQQFLARSLFMPPTFLHAAIHKEIEPSIAAFIAALQRSLPETPVDVLHLRSMFSMGALLMFSMQMGRMPSMRNPKFKEVLLRELVRFISTGLQSPPAVVLKDREPLPLPPKFPKRQ